MGFSLYLVGETIGRPLDSPQFQAGDQWSPLHKKSIELALFYYFIIYIITYKSCFVNNIKKIWHYM